MFKIKKEYYILPLLKTTLLLIPCIWLIASSTFLIQYNFYFGLFSFFLGSAPIFVVVNNYADEIHKKNNSKLAKKRNGYE